MIRLAVVGCMGRMGQRITELASQGKDFEIVALVERPDCPDLPETIAGVKVSRDIAAINGADVLIDFTLPEAVAKNVQACLQYRVRMVIGTTGLGEAQDKAILEASRKLAVVRSSNMSVGVNILFGLIRKAGEAMRGEYGISIEETHHVHKKDAPSGTAKTMAGIVKDVSRQQSVAIKSAREGEVVGYHKITFDSPVDTLEIAHNAKTRDIFAEGALVAARFVANKDAGLFNMQDVLGLN